MLSFLPLAAAVVWPWQPQLAERALRQYCEREQLSLFTSGSAQSAALAVEYWRWLSHVQRSGEGSVLATPELPPRTVAALVAMPDAAANPLGFELRALPADMTAGVQAEARDVAPPRGSSSADVLVAESAAAEARSRAWVRRVLSPSGLAQCPFTASDDLAAVRLESLGVSAAPILHAVSSEGSAAGLLVDVWECCERMLSAGEEGYSSIVLSAPAWDGRWEEWHRDVFPLLEETALAAGLGRTLGIVCFHPAYQVPSPEFLARHRFGHMHGVPTLRRWLEQASAPSSRGAHRRVPLSRPPTRRRHAHARTPPPPCAPSPSVSTRTRTHVPLRVLRSSARATLSCPRANAPRQHSPALSDETDDEALGWAGSYMRRSPHAMVNVLWSRQLEVAEGKRESSRLYATNIARLLAAGRDRLDLEADAERGL